IVCFFSLASAAAYSQSPSLQLIPLPKRIAPSASEFMIGREARIVLDDSKSKDDRLAAEDLIADLKQTAGVTVKIGGGVRGEILIGLIDRPRMQQALKRGGLDPAAQALNDEGYLLTVGRKQIVVAGKTSAGTFYGL